MRKHQWTYERLGWNHLDAEQRHLFETIELELMPLRRDLRRLMEAELTNDQIAGIFKGAEDISREQKLRTGFGKAVNFPKDTLLKVNKILSNFGTKLQNSKPVAKADEMFDKLKSNLRAKLEKSPAGRQALAYVDALGNAAKAHPAWQGAIIGLLTAILGMSFGAALIPVIAFLLKGAAELVKGEKLSTAVGKGIYAGALGYLGSQIAGALMGWAESLRIAGITPVGPSDLGFRTINFSGQSVNTVNGMEWTRWFRVSNVTVDPAMQGAINDAILRMGSGDLGAYDRLLNLARKVASAEYLDQLKGQLDAATAARISNDGFLTSIRAVKNFVVSAAGGAGAAAAGAGEKPKTTTAESIEIKSPILEGLWADLTLKFGAGKLNKAWQQAGRPTDSVEIAEMLANMGMESDDIRQLMTNAGLSAEDVDATMRGMSMASDDDSEVPFRSGFEELDAEAANIFKTKGSEAFVKYWEDKVKELESKVSEPEATKEPETPPAAAGKTDWPALRGDIVAAMKNKDRNKARELIGKLTDLTGPQKDILLTNIKASGLDQNTQMQLRKLVDKATVAEDLFAEISSILNENRMTWKDLGYQHVFREPRTRTVILL